MNSLQTDKMNTPDPIWVSFFTWVKDNWLPLSCVGLVWKVIDKVFRYFSDSRDAELREIVKDEIKNSINPEIERLSKSINKLEESIWALKSK